MNKIIWLVIAVIVITLAVFVIIGEDQSELDATGGIETATSTVEVKEWQAEDGKDKG